MLHGNSECLRTGVRQRHEMRNGIVAPTVARVMHGQGEVAIFA